MSVLYFFIMLGLSLFGLVVDVEYAITGFFLGMYICMIIHFELIDKENAKR